MASQKVELDSEEGYEPFEVYTGDQARRALNVASVRSVTERAETVERQGAVVGWRKDSPGNTTQVNLFLASWVDGLTSRNGSLKANVRPSVMYLPRLPGMTAAAASARPAHQLDQPHEYTVDTPESELDLARRQAAVEHNRRLILERDAAREKLEVVLQAKDATIELLSEKLKLTERQLETNNEYLRLQIEAHVAQLQAQAAQLQAQAALIPGTGSRG